MFYIFDESNMVAYEDHEGQWWRVVKDCVRCGECCRDRDPRWPFAADEYLGGCKYLVEEEDGPTSCGLGSKRPFDCCGNSAHSTVEYCKVVLEKMEPPDKVWIESLRKWLHG